MNDYLLSLILGVVEGVTEFLPVSSTAHLRIAEALLGIDLGNGYWKMFSIVIQLGAILCLPIYFRSRIAEFLGTFPRGKRGDKTALSHPLTLTLIAFICTAGPSFILRKVIGKNLENLLLMGCALLIGGIAMWVVDVMFGARGTVKDVDEITLRQSVWVGLCQNLSAIFPGTSRSMATIAGGQLVGFTRATALEFSFLLSIPTMVAATGYDLLKYLKESRSSGGAHLDSHGVAILAIGFVISFLVAWGVVAWFMSWVRERGFVPFAIYRIVLGAVVVFWAFSH